MNYLASKEKIVDKKETKIAWELDPKEVTKRLLKDIPNGLRYTQRDKEQAIDEAISSIVLSSMQRGVPGEIINHLSKETRDVLQHCSSQDWMHRIPTWLDNDKSLDAQIRRMAPNWNKKNGRRR